MIPAVPPVGVARMAAREWQLERVQISVMQIISPSRREYLKNFFDHVRLRAELRRGIEK
jgi:hypothetical protein